MNAPAAEASAPARRLRKWYFAINETGLRRSRYLLGMAIRSCLANTGLKPFCIYNGGERPELDWLRRMGVTVIPHAPRLEADLRRGYGEKYNQFVGHWLRTDLPLIESEDEFVLYTDIDVMFLKDVDLDGPGPAYLSAAPEHDMDNWSYFNSGVLILNMENMRRELPRFHAAISSRLSANFRYPPHDQHSFNAYFRDQAERLDLRLNWKPYWGLNPEAAIIHFHGPKPHNVEKIMEAQEKGEAVKLKRGLVTIWQRDPAAYRHYMRLADLFA